MMKLEEVRRVLKRVRISVVAAETGLHPHTIRSVLHGKSDPTYDTVLRLSDWIESISKPTEGRS